MLTTRVKYTVTSSSTSFFSALNIIVIKEETTVEIGPIDFNFLPMWHKLDGRASLLFRRSHFPVGTHILCNQKISSMHTLTIKLAVFWEPPAASDRATRIFGSCLWGIRVVFALLPYDSPLERVHFDGLSARCTQQNARSIYFFVQQAGRQVKNIENAKQSKSTNFGA